MAEQASQTGTYCPDCRRVLPPEALHCARCGGSRPELGWPVDDLLSAAVAGRFRIEGILGEGAFGTVYVATHLQLGGRRAIKVLRGELLRDEALLERFWLEARALYRLEAPQLVKVEAYGQLDDGRPFMVMERVQGHRLDRVIRRHGWLAPLRTIRIGRQVLLALAEAHEAGVLHRDLKAENVIVHADDTLGERVKVLDLGIARILGDSRRLTGEAHTVGTPEYMSPEQWHGRDDLDARADLYSFGILLYEMLAGEVPFPRHVAGPAAIYSTMMSRRPAPISLIRDDLPSGLEGYIFRLLSRQREGRPPDCLSALRELETIRKQVGS